MKKFMAFTMSAVMLLSLAACAKTDAEETTTAAETEATTTAAETEATTTAAETEAVETEAVETEAATVEAMSYDEYMAAKVDEEVVITAYVQATQSWYNDCITAYLADEDGAYFCYKMACSEEDAALLVPGTEIKVTGYKAEWSGEVELAEGATFEILDGNYIAEAKDVTDLVGSDEIVDYQNQLVKFTDMTVVSVEFKDDEYDKDIYLTVSKDDTEYGFCLEYYLNGSDEEFYNLVSGLEAGQTVDVEGFLYWYEGVNTHITAVTVK